jgi:carbamoyl-phosphate synthase large subunit
VVSEPEVIKIGDDKWDTVEFLKVNGFPYPATARSTDIDAVEDLIVSVGFPLIAKPRTGARSAGVMKLKSRADLDLVLKHKNYIIQEFLEDGVGEFTAGTMTYNKVCYSCVIFKRDLREGNTFRAYSYDSKEHESLLEKVSKALPGVYGPINFQYRIKNGVPVIFEINSRFSGTTPLRTAIGVNEIEMALDYIENRTLVTHKASKKDIAIFRTWSDVIVPMDQVRTFKESNVLAEPNALYFPFKNEIRK